MLPGLGKTSDELFFIGFAQVKKNKIVIGKLEVIFLLFLGKLNLKNMFYVENNSASFYSHRKVAQTILRLASFWRYMTMITHLLNTGNLRLLGKYPQLWENQVIIWMKSSSFIDLFNGKMKNNENNILRLIWALPYVFQCANNGIYEKIARQILLEVK